MDLVEHYQRGSRGPLTRERLAAVFAVVPAEIPRALVPLHHHASQGCLAHLAWPGNKHHFLREIASHLCFEGSLLHTTIVASTHNLSRHFMLYGKIGRAPGSGRGSNGQLRLLSVPVTATGRYWRHDPFEKTTRWDRCSALVISRNSRSGGMSGGLGSPAGWRHHGSLSPKWAESTSTPRRSLMDATESVCTRAVLLDPYAAAVV